MFMQNKCYYVLSRYRLIYATQNYANAFAICVSVQVCGQEVLPSINTSGILPRPLRPVDDVIVCQSVLLHGMWTYMMKRPPPLFSDIVNRKQTSSSRCACYQIDNLDCSMIQVYPSQNVKKYIVPFAFLGDETV